MPFTWGGVAVAAQAGDNMRSRLVAGLYPHLIDRTVTLDLLHAAVDAALDQSGYADLATSAFTADQLVQAFQLDTGVAAPTGYTAISDDWSDARAATATNPVNTDLIQTLEP